tara:strand:+ start:5284 stop:7998 length:2715 start_codon:yes stop_codon:yes gene_type:complete
MPSNYKTVINFRDGIQVDTDDLISNNGLVGIGSTIPRQQLDVRGNVIVDQNTELNNLKVTGVQTNYGILNVGTGYSVGIGTTIPEAAFQVGIGSTGFTVTEDGDVIGKSFTGDGSALTGIPASVWVNPGAGDTIYSIKKVGIGTTLTRGNAGFGVGYEIYMDPVSGVGTFEGVVTKNLTVTNTTGQGQGNVNADVGTFSTVTATTSVSAPSFIGTVTNAVRSVVSAGLTDSPNIDVNYIAGVGGTFTGITSFTTLQVTGGIVASAGIVTATTFSGSATTAANAAVAYGIAGDPDIQVDQLTVNGVAPSIIKGSGVSTIGQDLVVGEFLGVGNTSASAGNAAGFIGTVRVHDGDLILGGSISIGGSLVGSVELGSTQTINVLNVGAGLSVAGVTTFTGTVTGSSDFNIIGSATANELNSNDSIIAGGGITCGGGVVVGNAVAGSAINVLNGGGLILGSGITMSGSIEGATDINMNGTLSGISTIAASGEITGVTDISASGQLTGITTISMAGVGEFNGVNKITGIGSIIGSGQWHTTSMLTAGHLKSDRIDQGTSGVSTLGTANITHLNVSGGKFDFNKTSGIASATSFYSPAGLSTFSDIRVTNGGNTYMFARYIGVNTATPRITDGIEINGGVSELYVDGVGSSGIGIGSTGGQRLDDARFYVGYGRTAGGGIDNTTSIFECGNIGIGTTSVQSSSNGVETVEIYRNVRIYNNHAGVGGTVGMSTNIVQVGWNTEQPGGPLDLRAAGGPLCLPVADGDQDGAGMSYFHSDGDNIGNLWFDKYDMKLRVGMGQGSGNYIGLRTETYGKELNDWHGIRGWKGPIFTSVASRNTQTPFLPVEQAVGWSTANLGYYLPTNQFQHFASDGTWRTQVSSATTGVELIVNGTTAILNVAGIGSITLGTLS